MMAYDPIKGRVVLFGGYSGSGSPSGLLGDTWEWDGTNWTQLTPTTSPSPRMAASMVFDPNMKKMIMFGGHFAVHWQYDTDETWTWDGKTWAQLSPTTKPVGSSNDSMVYDSRIGRVILAGGHLKTGVRRSTVWTWTGTNWQTMTGTGSGPMASSAGMAFDSRLGRSSFFGGSRSTSLSSETWELGPKSGWTDLGGASTCFGNVPPQTSGTGGGIGQTATLAIKSAPPQSYCLLAFNLASSTTTLAGGTWHVSPPLYLWSHGGTGGGLLTPGSGAFSAQIPIPAQAYFRGVKVYFQGMFIDLSHSPVMCLGSGMKLTIF